MTIKEIAEMTNVSAETVRRWVHNLPQNVEGIKERLSLAKKSGKTSVDFSLPEVIEIVRAGGNETLAKMLMDNAAMKQLDEKKSSTLSGNHFDILRSMIDTLEAQEKRLSAVESEISSIKKQSPKALTAPQKTDRATLNQIVRLYADAQCSGDFRQAWAWLYQECLYRLSRNFPLCAKHEGISTLDYIDREGYMSHVLSIARECLRNDKLLA
jgi:DNA-binding transcriptional MerR regulator